MTAIAALNRLAKWRVLFAGWQLGTRPKGDPECDAVSDHREATILMRAEVNAMTQLLIAKGVFTLEDWNNQIVTEAQFLNEAYEKQFPGAEATDIGMSFDHRATPWMSKWKP